MTDNPDETLPVEQRGRKPLTLTCRCGAANERSLPYGLNPVDWCQECGMLFGDGDKPPRYMPGFPLSGVPAQSPPPVVSEAPTLADVERQLHALIEASKDRGGMNLHDWVAARMRDAAYRALSTERLPSPSRGCDLETVEAQRAEAFDEAARIAVNHSNYGHVEGNKRAFTIARDLEHRAAAIRDLGKETRQGEG